MKNRFVGMMLLSSFIFCLEGNHNYVTGASFQGDEIRVNSNICFGNFEQDDDIQNGKEPIEWRVLRIDEDNRQALLLSKNCLDCQPFHAEVSEESDLEECTWEECTLRSWLNSNLEGGFLYEAFSEEEQEQIIKTLVQPIENGHFTQADPGGETQDYIFLLSEQDAREYFNCASDRRALTTEWASQKQKKDTEDSENEETEEYWIDTRNTTGGSFWWLRTPGEDNTYAECIGAEGAIVQTGYMIEQQFFGVRPALWVILD